MSEELSEAKTAGSSSSNIITVLGQICDAASEDLSTSVEIEATRTMPDIAKLALEKNQDGKFVWKKIEDASVVATDLKSSTAVSYGKQDRVGARLYQASTGNCARVLSAFSPDFVDIQGDGLFAIFAGDRHVERAMCAAVSLNYFGHKLKPLLAKQFGEEVPEMKESGLKIGADRGLLLVKKIGVRGRHNEPVWAGKPVNYATKCAQAAKAGEVIVTRRFFKEFRDNDYVRFTCGCVAGVPDQDVGPLWQETTVEKLGANDQGAALLGSCWCDLHGPEFCKAVLAGEKDRDGLNTGALKKWREVPAEAEVTDVAA